MVIVINTIQSFCKRTQNLLRTIKIWRSYSEQGPNDWYTASHKGSLNLEVERLIMVDGVEHLINNGYMNTQKNILQYSQVTQLVDNCYAMAFFLRGGGTGGAIYPYCFRSTPLSWSGGNLT